MRHDHLYAKHQRASSPPFRKSKRGLDDWMRSLRSIDQHPYDLSDIQSLKQCIVPKVEFTDSETGFEYFPDGGGDAEDFRREYE